MIPALAGADDSKVALPPCCAGNATVPAFGAGGGA
jgi:hypothetical protein